MLNIGGGLLPVASVGSSDSAHDFSTTAPSHQPQQRHCYQQQSPNHHNHQAQQQHAMATSGSVNGSGGAAALTSSSRNTSTNDDFTRSLSESNSRHHHHTHHHQQQPISPSAAAITHDSVSPETNSHIVPIVAFPEAKHDSHHFHVPNSSHERSVESMLGNSALPPEESTPAEQLVVVVPPPSVTHHQLRRRRSSSASSSSTSSSFSGSTIVVPPSPLRPPTPPRPREGQAGPTMSRPANINVHFGNADAVTVVDVRGLQTSATMSGSSSALLTSSTTNGLTTAEPTTTPNGSTRRVLVHPAAPSTPTPPRDSGTPKGTRGFVIQTGEGATESPGSTSASSQQLDTCPIPNGSGRANSRHTLSVDDDPLSDGGGGSFDHNDNDSDDEDDDVPLPFHKRPTVTANDRISPSAAPNGVSTITTNVSGLATTSSSFRTVVVAVTPRGGDQPAATSSSFTPRHFNVNRNTNFFGATVAPNGNSNTTTGAADHKKSIFGGHAHMRMSLAFSKADNDACSHCYGTQVINDAALMISSAISTASKDLHRQLMVDGIGASSANNNNQLLTQPSPSTRRMSGSNSGSSGGTVSIGNLSINSQDGAGRATIFSAPPMNSSYRHQQDDTTVLLRRQLEGLDSEAILTMAAVTLRHFATIYNAVENRLSDPCTCGSVAMQAFDPSSPMVTQMQHKRANNDDNELDDDNDDDDAEDSDDPLSSRGNGRAGGPLSELDADDDEEGEYNPPQAAAASDHRYLSAEVGSPTTSSSSDSSRSTTDRGSRQLTPSGGLDDNPELAGAFQNHRTHVAASLSSTTGGVVCAEPVMRESTTLISVPTNGSSAQQSSSGGGHHYNSPQPQQHHTTKKPVPGSISPTPSGTSRVVIPTPPLSGSPLTGRPLSMRGSTTIVVSQPNGVEAHPPRRTSAPTQQQQQYHVQQQQPQQQQQRQRSVNFSNAELTDLGVGSRPANTSPNVQHHLLSDMSDQLQQPRRLSNGSSSTPISPKHSNNHRKQRQSLQPRKSLIVSTTVELDEDDVSGFEMVNQYLMMEEIGAGTSGVVYAVCNTTTNNDFAMKAIKRDRFANRRESIAPATTNREVAIMKKLRHPHVVRLHEVIDDPTHNKLYLVMQLLTGGRLCPSLDATTGACEPVSSELLKRYVYQMCDGLRYLHQHNIIHRDVKPENMMLDEGGNVVLVDFGVSEVAADEQNTVEGAVGTPAFMAPEVWAGDRVSGAAADVWSLGVSVFMMLVGRSPFHAANRAALIDMVRRSEPSFPDDIEPEWRKLLKGMLSKDPATRSSLSAVMRNKMFADLVPVDHKPNPMRGTIVVTEDDLQDAIAEREDVELLLNAGDLVAVSGSGELRVGGFGSGASLIAVRSAGDYAAVSPAGSGGSRSMMISLPHVSVDSPSNIIHGTAQNNTTTSSSSSSTTPTSGQQLPHHILGFVAGGISPTGLQQRLVVAGSSSHIALLSPVLGASGEHKPQRQHSIDSITGSVAFGTREASSVVVGSPSMGDANAIRGSNTMVVPESSTSIPFHQIRKGSSGSSTELVEGNGLTAGQRVASVVVLSEEKIARALASRKHRHA